MNNSKSKLFVKLLVGYIFLLPIIFIRPIILIRFGISHSTRIGHFALWIDLYLSSLSFGIGRPKTKFIDIWCFDAPTANKFLEKKWKEIINVKKYWVVSSIISCIKKNPALHDHLIPHYDTTVVGTNIGTSMIHEYFDMNIELKTDPLLSFSNSEMQEGENKLLELGIENHSFICFHSRDSKYLKSKFPNTDWSYHDYRDVDINTFSQAITELSKRKYKCIRMGKNTNKGVDFNVKGVIDYSKHQETSDFLDIFLSAHCKFFISTGSGIGDMARLFRRPLMCTNLAPVYSIYTSGAKIVIFKLLWMNKEKRYMTFSEIFSSDLFKVDSSCLFKDYDVALHCNSKEDIADAAIEMDDRLNGVWKESEESVILQEKFWNIFPVQPDSTKKRTRIGASFLKKYSYLL